MNSFKLGILKGHNLSRKRVRKGTFSAKNGILKCKGLDLGTEPPLIKLICVPTGDLLRSVMIQ